MKIGQLSKPKKMGLKAHPIHNTVLKRANYSGLWANVTPNKLSSSRKLKKIRENGN